MTKNYLRDSEKQAKTLFDTRYLLNALDALNKKDYERIYAEKKTIEIQGQLQAIFNFSSDLMFTKNNSLKYIMVNPTMAEFLNKSGRELIDRTDEELFDKKTTDHFRELELRVLQGESIEEEYSRYVDGEKLTFLESRIPIKNEFGEIIGLSGISKNISGRRAVTIPGLITEYSCRSHAMKECLKSVSLVARKDTPVLLLGESGSGKDFLAKVLTQSFS